MPTSSCVVHLCAYGWVRVGVGVGASARVRVRSCMLLYAMLCAIGYQLCAHVRSCMFVRVRAYVLYALLCVCGQWLHVHVGSFMHACMHTHAHVRDQQTHYVCVCLCTRICVVVPAAVQSKGLTGGCPKFACAHLNACP